jgi:hypothetical protein
MGQDVKGITVGLFLEDGNEFLLVVVGVADGQRADGPSFGMILPISECQGATRYAFHRFNAVVQMMAGEASSVLVSIGITWSIICPARAIFATALFTFVALGVSRGQAELVLVASGIARAEISP